MNIADTLHDKPVSELDLSRYVTVPSDATVATVVAAMNEAGRSCAFVTKDGALAGIFTQRDVLTKVVGEADVCDQPIETVMTPMPHTIRPSASVADGMAVMTEQWVRSVPVVADDGSIVGNFSFYTVMRLVSDLLGEKASRNESELSAQHGLMFVDFTGLHVAPAVAVLADDSLATVVHQMRARARGEVIVVDGREHVIGTLSEFDLQTQVACQTTDLAAMTVSDVMTPDPVTTSVRSPVADAVRRMAENRISHVPLVGESGRLVGQASFRDVANYFESSLAVLG